MREQICGCCKSKLTAYEVMLGVSCCLSCERLNGEIRNRGSEQRMRMEHPEFINPYPYSTNFNTNDFNRSLDVISLITWGLKENIIFKNEYNEKISSVEDILSTFRKGNSVYIETNDIDFVKLLQEKIKQAQSEYEKEYQASQQIEQLNEGESNIQQINNIEITHEELFIEINNEHQI